MAVRYSGRSKIVFTRLPEPFKKTVETFFTIARPDGIKVKDGKVYLTRFFANLDKIAARLFGDAYRAHQLEAKDLELDHDGDTIYISKRPFERTASPHPYR